MDAAVQIDIQAKMNHMIAFWRWWDKTDETALQTQDLKTEPFLSQILSTIPNRG